VRRRKLSAVGGHDSGQAAKSRRLSFDSDPSNEV
jgi:hypothetical protein